jgi:hypothetical protein
MGSKSSKGLPLRLRLHDPSSVPIKSSEASMIQKSQYTIPLLQSSRLHSSNTSGRPESLAMPNRSAIYKMSSSPYFKVFFLFALFHRLLIAQVIFCISIICVENIFSRVPFFRSFLLTTKVCSDQFGYI